MDKDYDQKIFILVLFLSEKPFKGITLMDVLKPALVIEFDHRKAVTIYFFDWLLPPLLGVRNRAKREPTSEKISTDVAIHRVTLGSKRQARRAFRRCPLPSVNGSQLDLLVRFGTPA
jgi:hypothetical protein